MLRRMLPTILILNILLLISSIALAMLMPTYLLGSLSPTSFAKETDQPIKCPDVPDLNVPMLDFCSPKNHGDVAGPYGAHITLASEHLPASPDHWVFEKKNNPADLNEKPFDDSTALADCIQKTKEKCIVVPASAIHSSGQEPQAPQKPKRDLYSFTWSGGDFPTQQDQDYYIGALNGDLANPKILAWTPAAYSLLTTEAPCIALSIDQNSSSCTSTTSNFTVQLVGDQPQNLTITGKNWRLGSLAQGDEQVQVTATCSSGQQCNPQKLFANPYDVNKDGTFQNKASIPANASGNYIIHVVNHVTNTTQPGQSDYQPGSQNTVADGTLTFGDDPTTGFALRVQPPVTSNNGNNQNTGVNPNHPGTTGSGRPDETQMFPQALLAAIPAALSIIAFFTLWWVRRSSNIVYQSPPASKSSLTLAPSLAFLRPRAKTAQISPSLTHQNSSIAPPSMDFLLNHFLPPHIRLLENAQRSPSMGSPRAPRNPIPNQEINQAALDQWERNRDLTQAVNVTESLLYGNVPAWRDFHGQLLQSSSRQRLSQELQQQLLIRAEHEYNAALSDSSQRLKHCSKTLTYYTVLLSTPVTDIVQAMIHYRMGFTYILLALDTDSPVEIIGLLTEADRNYSTSYPTLERTYAQSQPDFLASIDLAVGDINTAIARWQRGSNSNKAQEYLRKANSVYERVATYGSQTLKTELYKRQN
jgi:hypothetical protein